MNYPDLGRTRNQKLRFGTGDLESTRGASSHGTRRRNEPNPTIDLRNPPPSDRRAARTLERWDSTRRRLRNETALPLQTG